MPKGSKDPVVEHKGIVRLTPAGVQLFLCIFSSFRWQTKSTVCPPIVCQRCGGPRGAKNL